MNVAGLEKAGALILLVLGSQAWARWRVGRRERRAQAMPLFDVVALEAALAPRQSGGDDAALLETLREVFRLHNHQRDGGALALHVAQMYAARPEPQRAAVRRALDRLHVSEDESLRRVAAEALAQISALTPGPHRPAGSAQ